MGSQDALASCHSASDCPALRGCSPTPRCLQRLSKLHSMRLWCCFTLTGHQVSAMSNAKANKDWVRLAQQPGKIERIEAYFSGHGYEPHRHDTYAIGRTLSGVQSFHYRGVNNIACRAGQWSCTLTKYMTERRERTTDSSIGCCISIRR